MMLSATSSASGTSCPVLGLDAFLITSGGITRANEAPASAHSLPDGEVMWLIPMEGMVSVIMASSPVAGVPVVSIPLSPGLL